MLRGRLVDHDAHGAVGRMGADIDHRAREALVAHCRHRDQELSVEIAAPGVFPDLLRGIFIAQDYPIVPLLQTTPLAESSHRPLSD